MNEEIKIIVNNIVEAINPIKIILFGSYARGDFTCDSDIDIYIVVNDKEKDLIKLTQDAYRSIMLIDRRDVDIVINNESKYNYNKNNTSFERTIAREGKVIYVEAKQILCSPHRRG